MKNLKDLKTTGLYFMLLISITLISCSEDDGGDFNSEIRIEKELTPSFLLGTWIFESVTSDNAIDYNNDGSSSTNILSQYDIDTQDNAFFFITNGLKYQILDDTIRRDVLENGIYEIDNNTIEFIDTSDNKFFFNNVKALQDNNGNGVRFLEFTNSENHLVILRAFE